MQQKRPKGSFPRKLIIIVQLAAICQQAYGTYSLPGELCQERIAAVAEEFARKRTSRLQKRFLMQGVLIGAIGVLCFARARAHDAMSDEAVRQAYLDGLKIQVPPDTAKAAADSGARQGIIKRFLSSLCTTIKNSGIWIVRDIMLASMIQRTVDRLLYPFGRRLFRDEYAVSTSSSWFVARQSLGVVRSSPTQGFAVVHADLYAFIGELTAWDYEMATAQATNSLEQLVLRGERLTRRAERICAHILAQTSCVEEYECELLSSLYPDIYQQISEALRDWYQNMKQLLSASSPAGTQEQEQRVQQVEALCERCTQRVRHACCCLLPLHAYRVEPVSLEVALRSWLPEVILERLPV